MTGHRIYMGLPPLSSTALVNIMPPTASVSNRSIKMSEQPAGGPETIQELLTREQNDNMVSGRIHYLDTAMAYDLWSTVYDTDGNFLQALDSLEIPDLLSAVFSQISTWQTRELTVVDLGCGTGRNTLQLLDQTPGPPWSITAMDLSPKMLEIAKSHCEKKLSTLNPTAPAPTLRFDVFDMINSPTLPVTENSADLVVSTLVLEHIPLQTFMKTVQRLLKPGGYLVLTNMHSQMGGISQAGFVDPKTGDKIRPVSYAHTVRDTVVAGKEAGLDCVAQWDDGKCSVSESEGSMKEIAITEELAKRLGARAKKWVGISVWFGGIFRKGA